MRTIVWLIAAGGLMAAAPQRENAAPELRGVWVQPYAMTGDTRAATIDQIERLRVNTVFLRTPTLGENRGEGNAADFEAMLGELTRRGISAHAWITNKMRTGDPRKADAQADFTDEGERAAQAAWAVAVMDRWPTLDGVHLDYVRYTDWAPPDAKKMDAVTATVAAIRAALRDKHPKAKLTAAVFTADYSYLGGRWGAGGAVQWDGDVPAWYDAWYRADANNVYATRPAAEHAAGRFKGFGQKHAYGPTFFHVQQDPVTWLRRDLLDAVIVMQYSADRDRWRVEADTWKGFVGDKADRVSLGLGWLIEDGQPDWRHDAAAMADHARYAGEIGLGGTSVFTLGVRGVDDGPLVEALAGEGGPWANDASSPLRRAE